MIGYAFLANLATLAFAQQQPSAHLVKNQPIDLKIFAGQKIYVELCGSKVAKC